MMKWVVVALLVVVAVASAQVENIQYPVSTNVKDASHNACVFTNQQGDIVDLRLLLAGGRYTANDTIPYYWNPCRPAMSPCGDERSSSFCIYLHDEYISYGSFTNLRMTQLSESQNHGTTYEFIYGSGEVCSTGVERKTIVTHICSPVNRILTKIEECTATVTIRSIAACGVEAQCDSLKSESKCKASFGRCQWTSKTGCIATHITLPTPIAHHSSEFIVPLWAYLYVSGFLLASCILCTISILRRRRAAKQITRVSQKSANKKAQTAEKQFDSFAVPYELVPGGFVSAHAYDPMQNAYPMQTFPPQPQRETV